MPWRNDASGTIVLVVHGAEIFDSGEAAWLMKTLRPVRTIVAGVMARTAAEESGLPVQFEGVPPSRVIRAITEPVVFADHAKSPESGKIFGNIIASRLDRRGLVQIECLQKIINIWDEGDRNLVSGISCLTGYPLIYLSSTCDQPGRERRIRGCLPGEPVYVNGIVIGRATENTIILRRNGSSIEVVRGIIPKEHGIEKLREMNPDLSTAWCKSGRIRSALPFSSARKSALYGRVVVIDHCGHELYAKLGPDCCGVLAIGDDTTAVCGHICAHRGIGVLGIIDGDQDSVLPSAFAPESIVLEVRSGRDDDLGREVAQMVGGGPVEWDEWIDLVLAHIGSRVRIMVDTREAR